MNAERLLQLYDRVSDGPDAIPRLRRFILDLAVRGKLVEQDPKDEPASELVKRVPDEQLQLFQSGKIRKPVSKEVQSLASLKDARSNWTVVRGTDLFPTRSGNSKLIKGRLYSEPGPKRYPGYSAAGQDVWLDDWEHEGTAIILSAVGARCGKAFLAAGRWSAIANTHVIWVMPEITAPAYAMLNLNNEDFWVRSGGAQPFVKVRATLEKPFHLPPLAEQHRIVAKVDELMALCDSLEAEREKREATRDRLTTASLSRITAPDVDEEQFKAHADCAIKVLPELTTRPDQIKVLQQTILDLAVRGKLVKQDPRDQPFSDVTLGVLKETYRPPEMVANSGEAQLTEKVPLGWESHEFGMLVLDSRVGLDRRRASQGPGRRYKYLRMNNINNEGGLNFIDVARIDASSEEVEKFRLRDGDFLFNTRNSRELVGKTCVFRSSSRDVTLFNNNILRAKLKPGLSPEFVDFFFRSPTGRAQLEARKSNTTNVCAIYQGQLATVSCPVPPLAEQRRIVSRVEQLMSVCDQLQQRLLSRGDGLRRLLGSVLMEVLALSRTDSA